MLSRYPEFFFEAARFVIAFAESRDQRGEPILPVPELRFQALDAGIFLGQGCFHARLASAVLRQVVVEAMLLADNGLQAVANDLYFPLQGVTVGQRLL